MIIKKLSENYAKPTPPHWRKIGDMAILAIPIIEAAILTMPEPISEWNRWAITTFLALFKLYTNTKVDTTLYSGDL